MKAHKQFRLESEECGSCTWVFVRTWQRDSFYRVAVGVIDCYHGDASNKLVILGQMLCAIGSRTSPVSISGGVTHPCGMLQRVSGERIHARTVGLSNFWRQVFQTLPTKNCSTVFGIFESFSMTEFTVTRLKSAEHCDWMQSTQTLQRAIETSELSLPGLIGVVSNIIGVWPLVVSYLKETGKKDSGDGLVVWFSSFSFSFSMTAIAFFPFSCLERRDRWIILHWPVGKNEVSFVPSHPRFVLVFASTATIV